ncbi:hypothetical protein BJX99DRAFT_265681 [Aspergillus californicus]
MSSKPTTPKAECPRCQSLDEEFQAVSPLYKLQAPMTSYPVLLSSKHDLYGGSWSDVVTEIKESLEARLHKKYKCAVPMRVSGSIGPDVGKNVRNTGFFLALKPVTLNILLDFSQPVLVTEALLEKLFKGVPGGHGPWEVKNPWAQHEQVDDRLVKNSYCCFAQYRYGPATASNVDSDDLRSIGCGGVVLTCLTNVAMALS